MARRLVVGNMCAVQINVSRGKGRIDRDAEKTTGALLEFDTLRDFEVMKLGGLHVRRLKVVLQRLQINERHAGGKFVKLAGIANGREPRGVRSLQSFYKRNVPEFRDGVSSKTVALVDMAPLSEAPQAFIRVLLIEDNPGDVFLLSEMLRDAPIRFEIESVSRLSEALDRLDRGGIDVVLSDLSLPDSQGIGTFHRLLVHPARVPIVVLSGLDDESLALQTVEEGAQDYLVKGQLDQPLLVRSIRYAIKRADSERCLEQERALLRNVIDNLPDSIYVKDLEGRYLLDNQAHMRQIGAKSLEEVIGKTGIDFFPAHTAAAFQADDERVMRTGRPIINRHECVDDGSRSKLWLSTTKVPLRDVDGEIAGIIGISRDITARKDAEAQLALYTEELREKNAEMEDDLNMAREVQQAFLPQQFPSFPRKLPASQSALAFVSKYLPTTTLGGDFFHILPVSEMQAGIFICDVMGHGVRAALVTAIQRALVEELVEFADRPGEFLTRMNASLLSILRRTRSPMFVSAFYLLVNVEDATLQYANAGHPRPLHFKRDENSVALLTGQNARPGPALGVFEDSQYLTHHAAMAARDLVLLYTDGLYEVEGADGDYYDQGRLLEFVERRVQHGSDSIFEETLEEVRRFSFSGGFVDDVCLVGVEVQWVGAREPAHHALSEVGQIH
ncbi:MAG: putative sensor protein [Chthoniobacteraceae bacterium]|nr:putative sensor protein [Chthoniobacteraceae bacterium]